MVWPVLVAVLKPVVVVWAGLNAIDDAALLMRVGRLGTVMLPGRGNQANGGDLCEVCDDVMGDLLRGVDGLSAVPCGAACLGLKKCMDMCESVKEASATSTQFPCVAAGYCDAVDADVMTADPECHAGPFFSCLPRQYCRRRRTKLRMKCDLRPGIGRWVGVKHAAGDHVVALAQGLISQPHCGEEGAGPYCIAKPTGFGAIAEVAGDFITLVIGGYRSVVAIETPGGGDDRQWLTFWLILTVTLFCERFFARVILSTFPLYYEAKLALLVWLIWRSGAEKIYRRLRRVLANRKLLLSDERAATTQLEIMKTTGKDVVEDQLSLIIGAAQQREEKPPAGDWEYDRNTVSPATDYPGAAEQLYQLSKFIVSLEGAIALKESAGISEQNAALLIERAAAVINFQPRFLRARLHGTVDGPEGEVPAMDRNGLADAYVTCRLIPEYGEPYPKKGVSSSVSYGTLRPSWNEELEISLKGGTIDIDGYYKSNGAAASTLLQLDVRDADVGKWGITYRFFRVTVVCVIVLAMAARIEGVSDDLTEVQLGAATVAALVVGAGFVISYIKAVMRRLDDERIGICNVPLGILLDQREHALLLSLRESPSAKEESHDAVAITNSVGGLGVLRVSVMLSEQ